MGVQVPPSAPFFVPPSQHPSSWRASPAGHMFAEVRKVDSLPMMYLVLAIHIIVCLFIIIVVLLQSGQSADVAAAFGGMGSQTAFGPRSAANVLTRATTWAAVIFMLTSIILYVMVGRRGHGTSVLDGSTPAKQTVPAQPGAPAKGSNQEPQPVTR